MFLKPFKKRAPAEDIYDVNVVRDLFNRMSKTYGITNYISSFGFTERWRRQCINEINWNSTDTVGYDFMSGMGESWHLIYNHAIAKITGIDISQEMNMKVKLNLQRHPNWNIEIREEDILANKLESDSADFIVSTFGLKTFSDYQLGLLAKEVERILRKGGQISMIEISVPKWQILKVPYMFYLKRVIPLIGRLFQGDTDSYRMLGLYCEKFINCDKFRIELEKLSVEVVMKSYFFGCATGIIGRKRE